MVRNRNANQGALALAAFDQACSFKDFGPIFYIFKPSSIADRNLVKTPAIIFHG
jgi:hypothetical protein